MSGRLTEHGLILKLLDARIVELDKYARRYAGEMAIQARGAASGLRKARADIAADRHREETAGRGAA